MSTWSREKLDDADVAEHLAQLEGWSRTGDKIRRELKFGDFMSAIAFINRIAAHAEELDHHPELFNVYDNVHIELTTHDADGLTALDFELARRIDSSVEG